MRATAHGPARTVAPAPASAAAAPGPAAWVGVDGEVTLFSPRVGACLRLDGGAAAQLVAAGAGQSPTDPLVRLACAGAPPLGAHVTGPLAVPTAPWAASHAGAIASPTGAMTSPTGGTVSPAGAPARGPAERAALQTALTAAALAPAAGHGRLDHLAWLSRHRLTGHLWPVRATLPAGLGAAVAAAHASMLERRLRALSDLAAWARVMDRASIGWLVAKGPVTAAAYPRPDARTWGDLDVLVAPADLGPALATLTGAGWYLVDRNHLLLRAVVPSEVHLVAPSGTVVDLHWSLTSTRMRAAGTGTATADLLARATTVDVGGLDAPALHPADALVHLCVHAAASGADRLGWLADVAAASPGDGAGWDDVVAAAGRWSARAAVAGVLERAALVLGPEAVGGPGLRAAAALRASLPPTSRAATARTAARAVEAISPVVVSTGVGSPPARLARAWVGIGPSARPGDVLRALRGQRRRPFVDGEDEPGSALHASGTAADLAAFCAEVAARDGAPEGRARRR